MIKDDSECQVKVTVPCRANKILGIWSVCHFWVKLSLELHTANGIRETEERLIVSYVNFTHVAPVTRRPRPLPPLGEASFRSARLWAAETVTRTVHPC